MATLEKLVKAFEGLKVVQLSSPVYDENIRKKEKITHCITIADAMCNSGVKGSHDFSQLISVAIETLLQLCDDQDSNVRMIADESLNRIIRALTDSNVVKIQVELHKEIKKNGNARTLRAALWRFAELCHMIRPVKGKPYVVNLIPCIVQIARRTDEESVLETLAAALQKIFKALGSFTNDNEIKTLLKAFLQNLSSPSAVARRTAASSILSICLHCRKPLAFLSWVLQCLLEIVEPVLAKGFESGKTTLPVDAGPLLGVLGCLRHILPHLSTSEASNKIAAPGAAMEGSASLPRHNPEGTNFPRIESIFQVYELSLICAQHEDHNVVNAALETLQQLLRCPPSGLTLLLLETSPSSMISKTPLAGQINLSTPMKTNNINDDSLEENKKKMLLDKCDSQDNGEEIFFEIDFDKKKMSNDTNEVEEKNISGNIIGERKVDDDKLEPHSRTIQWLRGHKYLQAREGISQLENCVRFLAASFLLQKNNGNGIQSDIQSVNTLVSCTVPDSMVRVSVKALALGCIANALALSPSLFFISLEPDVDKNIGLTEPEQSQDNVSKQNNGQPLSDVLLFASHTDPQLRGLTCILVGSLIWAALIESGGDFQAFSKNSLSLDQLVSLLVQGLEDESSLCCRQTLGALQLCLGSLLESQGSPSAKVLLTALLPLNKNPYWLVKVKLLEVVSELPMVSLSHTLSASSSKLQGNFEWGRQPDFQDQVLHGILLNLLDDEDNRVRHAAAAAFVRIIPQLFFPTDYPGQDPATARASYLVSRYLLPVTAGWGPGGSLPLPSPAAHINGPPAPFGGKQHFGSLRRAAQLEDALSRVINLLSQSLLMSTSRYLTHGCCEALCMLSDEYLTTVYPWAWSCVLADKSSQKQTNSKESGDIGSSFESTGMSPACGLLSTALTLLTSTSVSLDLSAQTWLIRLAGNLFSGMAVYCSHRVDGGGSIEGESTHRQSWSVLGDRQLAASAEMLLGHVAKIIATFAHVLDETAPPHLASHPISSNPSPSPSPSPGPIISSPTPSISTSSVSAPSLPAVAAASLASPIKRRGTVGGITSQAPESSAGSNIPSSLSLDRGRAMSPSKSSLDKEDKLEDRKGTRGSYFSLSTITPHYMKIYDILKSAYVNYKITLDQNASEKFVRLLVFTLEVLSQLLEVASLHEIGRGAEELLGQLRSTVSLAPTPTVTCVHQLLKCLFGSNLCAQWEEEQGVLGVGLEHQSGMVPPFAARHPGDGFYSICFQSACHELAQSLGRPLPFVGDRISLTSQLPSAAGSLAPGTPNPTVMGHRDEGPGWLNSLKRRGERKVSSIFKNFGRSSDKASLASYIRLFEPMVIKALKQYTVTSDVQLQCRVLLLLSQLVQLRVNYCLLDSEQIFIGFVLKQFEFIESGQIPQAEELIPCIFYFLVHLSYEKQHSKAIIGVPKIIQLCDGLMASGQPHVTHCVPALIPVVEDVFVVRGKGLGGGSGGSSQAADLKELDTQREVLFSMLLRLSEYPQVLDLLAVVVRESRTESEELWRRWSRKAADAVLPLVAWGRVRLEGERDDRVTVYGAGCPQASLHRFLAALAPPVLRPVDPLLRTLFATTNHPSQVAAMEFAPNGQEGEVVGVERWLGMVLGVFLALLSPQQAKEEAVLARLEALGFSFRPHLPTHLDSETMTPADPLGAALVLTPPSNSPEQMPPEQVMARFIFHVMRIVVKKIHRIVFDPASQRDSTYLQEQFCHFLLYCIHMFESGSYSKVTNAAIEIVKSEGPGNENEGLRGDLSQLFLELTPVCPLLSCLWCYILILLEVSDRTLWSEMLGLREEPSPVNGSAHSPLQTKSLGTSPCCNIEVVKKAGTILFCGYLRGGVRGVMADHAAWLLVGHTEAVVRLSGEPPVRDFVAAVHQNSAASGLLVQALASRCQDLSSPSFAWNLLRCIEGVHPSQSGALLSQLLIPRLLSCPHLALSRRASAIACRRAELLLVQHLHQPPPAPPSPPPLSPGDLLVTAPVPTPTVGQLPKEELEKLLEVLQEARLMRKHSRLVNLLNKLGSQCYDLSPIDIEHGRSFNPATVRSITADRSWYLGQVKRRCCEQKCSGQEVAQLLSKLEFNDIISIMSCKDFNGSVLEHCLKLGLQLTLQALQGWSNSSFGSFEDLKTSDVGSPLYQASKITLLQSVHRLNGLVPRPHQVFLPVGRCHTQKEERYSSRLGELFADPEFWDALFQIIPSLTCYLNGLSRLTSVSSSITNENGENDEENQENVNQTKDNLCKVPQESIEDLAKFGILCLEAAHWLVVQDGGPRPEPQSLHYALEGAAAVLSCSSLSTWLTGDAPGNGSPLSATWVASGVSAVTQFIQYLLGGEQHLSCPFTASSSGLTSALEDSESVAGAHSCLQVAALIYWMERTKLKMPSIPKFLATPLKCIVIGLARMPLVNSYALVPPEALKQGWKGEPAGSYSTQLPPLPIEYLQEVEVLEQFVFRVTLLGWISRQQFEEMWVAFLGVLSTNPSEGTSPEETLIMAQANSLAVQSMTALLIQTLLLPTPGNPSVSHLIHQARDSPLDFQNSSTGQKLASIHELLCWRIRDFGLLGNDIQLQDVFHRGNLEKVNNSFRYGHSQVALEYLWTSTGAYSDTDTNAEINGIGNRQENKASQQCLERAQRLSESGLDLPSCLHFLVDLYSQWTNSQSTVPMHIVGESIRSLLALSDLFSEGMQFARMLRSCLNLLRIHAPEDQPTCQYLVLGACKAAAVLVANMSPASPDMEAQERVRRALELGLRSSFMPTRLASMHGLLYLLQAAFARSHVASGIGPMGTREDAQSGGSSKRSTPRPSKGEINMQQLSGKAGEVVRRAVSGGVGIVQPSIGNEVQLLLPIAVDYIQRHFGEDIGPYELEHNEEHTLLLWALVFFLLESLDEGREEAVPLLSSHPSSVNNMDGREGSASLPPVLRLALSILSQVASTPVSSPTSYGPFNQFTPSSSKSHPITLRIYLALMHGLERLVVSGSPVGVKVRMSAAGLAAELLRHSSPVVALPALQLLLSCMYMGLNQVQGEWISIDQKGEISNLETSDAPNPEYLLHAMEQTSALFDRVKRGYPFEVEVVCGVLPLLLTHFFPPSEILTKVIGEFLSIQQPHPRLLAAVLFQVFESACQQSQLPLLQEWVVLSLSNFTQCSPMGMATWCLACFFISASTNPWLRAIFPHVQSRIGRCEFEDRRLLCIAASDFYHQLTDDNQKQTFLSTFGTAATVHPLSPFSDIVTCLT